MRAARGSSATGCRGRSSSVVGEALEQPLEVLVRPLPAGPRQDDALGEGELRVADEQLGVDLQHGAEAGALGAGAERAR